MPVCSAFCILPNFTDWVVHLDRIYKMNKEHNAMLSSGGRLASRSDGKPDARHPFGASKRLPTILQHDLNKNAEMHIAIVMT